MKTTSTFSIFLNSITTTFGKWKNKRAVSNKKVNEREKAKRDFIAANFMVGKPTMFTRNVSRIFISILLTALIIPITAYLVSIPGGLPALIAELLVRLNISQGGHLSFQILYGAFSITVVILIFVLIAFISVFLNPITNEDTIDLLLINQTKLLDVLAGLQYDIQNEVIERLRQK